MKHVSSAHSTSNLTKVLPGDIQPNATDLRLDKVFAIEPKLFKIDELEKHHRGSIQIHPDSNEVYRLEPGSYEVIMLNEIFVGEGEAGFVITRSTLNRNGVYLTSGLYDSGYAGVMAAVMHVGIGPMEIQRGTRIGQYLSFEAEMLHEYDGSYGYGTADDKNYKGQ